MKFMRLIALLAIVSIAAIILLPSGLTAQKTEYAPNKELCAQMISAGKEYYARGRYLDAKNFFRKAVEADPRSQKAWLYYDQVVIFALAEKVEKKNDLLLPDISIRSDIGQTGGTLAPITTTPPVHATQPTPTAVGGQTGYAPAEQEGC